MQHRRGTPARQQQPCRACALPFPQLRVHRAAHNTCQQDTAGTARPAPRCTLPHPSALPSLCPPVPRARASGKAAAASNTLGMRHADHMHSLMASGGGGYEHAYMYEHAYRYEHTAHTFLNLLLGVLALVVGVAVARHPPHVSFPARPVPPHTCMRVCMRASTLEGRPSFFSLPLPPSPSKSSEGGQG